jgi:hypothetical protein
MKRKLLYVLAAIGFTLGTGARYGLVADDASDTTQILSVNGVYGRPTGPIEVRPGDVITLTADVVRTGGDCEIAEGCQLNVDLEDFRWSSDLSASDKCDPSDTTKSCLDDSNFETNDFGVSYYVPTDMTNDIKISVSYQGTDAIDEVILHNKDVVAEKVPDSVVTDPDDFPADVTFSQDTSLAGHGRWVYVSGTRYFVPYVYQDDWQPYTNGYWAYDDSYGWNWVTCDPWGWYTDHYGVWRHHRVYGMDLGGILDSQIRSVRCHLGLRRSISGLVSILRWLSRI